MTKAERVVVERTFSATELTITPEEADILGNLSSGSYDALLKFWEDGETNPDSDVFTNSITIKA